MEAVLREADFVSVHVSASAENTGLLGAEQLAMMKRGSYLISTSYAEAVRMSPRTHSRHAHSRHTLKPPPPPAPVWPPQQPK
jgi:hypothetical protein